MPTTTGLARVRPVLVEVAVIAAVEKLGRGAARRHRTKRAARLSSGGAARHRRVATGLLRAVVTAGTQVAVDELTSQRYRAEAAIDRAAATQRVLQHARR